MKRIKRIPEHTFVTIVGIAAFIHSTWTVATFSGGIAPEVRGGDPAIALLSILAWLWWVIPGALSAFALEVGQVVTARQIHAGVGRKLNLGIFKLNVKTLTFVGLSAGTYFLQLVYVLHHYPDLPLAAGIPEHSKVAGAQFMEFIVWGMPMLLPLTMLWFTAADEPQQRPIEALQSLSMPVAAKCPDCDWCGEYNDPVAAQNALNGHRRIHSLLPLSSSSGKH